MEERLQQLEQRLAHAEAQLAQLASGMASSSDRPTTFVTPVHVVTPDGILLLTIEHQQHDTSIRLHNAQGHTVASLGIDGTQAGYLAIRNSEGVLVGSLDVEQAGARLQLDDHRRLGGVVLFGGDSGEDAGGGINIKQKEGGSIELWSTLHGGEITLYGPDMELPLVTIPDRHPEPTISPKRVK